MNGNCKLYIKSLVFALVVSCSVYSFDFSVHAQTAGTWYTYPGSFGTAASSTSQTYGTSSIYGSSSSYTTTPSTAYQPVTAPTSYNIRSDVYPVYQSIISKYSLTIPQANAVGQIAQSMQYILDARPTSSAAAFEVLRRDVAATNCATSRLPANIMDDVYNTLETNTFDTVDRKAVFASYNNSISDASSNPNIVDACEDGYGSSSTNSSNINSANFIGIVADQNITYPCLVLTQFMEFGTRSSQVTSLQKFLSDTGYLEMWPTGFFGRNTEMGIKIWQQKHAIDVKGWAGPSTRGSIASVTCKGDAASVAKAKRGVVTGSKVVTKTTTSSQVNIPTTVVNTTPTIISSRVVATSSIPATISGKLSQGVGVFYLKRSPINSIYFTYSADTTRDVTYICFEKNGENRCATSTNFTELKSQYSPGDYDAIPTGDRWLITLYYSTAKWGDITTTGGKVYLRSGYNATSDVFFVNNVNALQ